MNDTATPMIRLLHVARYRHQMLDRKLALIAGTGDFDVSLVRPAPRRPLPAAAAPSGTGIGETVWIPLVGTNPHRAFYRTLSFALRRLRPDLIHAEEEPDSLSALQIAVARRLFAPRAPLVLHTWQNVDRAKRWYVWAVLRAVLSEADAVLCASQAAIGLLRRFGFDGLTAEIPQYGADLTIFRPHPARTPSDRLLVTYAGRLIADKGLDTLIDAIGRLNTPVRLSIIGDGPMRESLEARSRERSLSDRIDFVPRVTPERLGPMIAASDVLVLPSRTTAVWKEQFGRVLVEAMACEVPIVGSNSGAIPDVIGDAGLVFEEGRADALADCLSRLAASPALRRELGGRGRRRVLERYSQERVATQTAQFYRRISLPRLQKLEQPSGRSEARDDSIQKGFQNHE